MTMRISGRSSRRRPTRSRPLPSARRRSRTAYSGRCSVATSRASTALSAGSTSKPRRSSARASERRSGASSSTRSSFRPPPGGTIMVTASAPLCPSAELMTLLSRGSPLQSGAVPAYGDAGTSPCIAKLERGAGSRKQRLRDEHAEPEPAVVLPRGDVGLAEVLEDLVREAGAVILDAKVDPLAAQDHPEVDSALRELEGVLDQGDEA